MFKRVDNQDIIEQKLSDGNVKRYLKGRLLGKGGFAKCYEVISLQTQKKYAAKIIEKASLEKSKAKEKLTSQIKIHKSLSHAYIVHFEHYFEDSEFVYILLEKCSNQTLNELLKRRKRLTDIETKYYIRQLALAIKYMHEEHIIHRDLKLGNMFLSEKLEIKIGDFGLASKLTYVGERRKTKCGTPNYIAPEILDDKKTHSYEVDIWSMGVITYALLVGRPPFETNDVKDTYNKIKACNYSFPASANVPDIAKSFIQKMLQLDPCKRATIDQLLYDPFLMDQSIPPSLPISSLACPPSYDFLKKYRDLEKEAENSVSNSVLKNLEQSQSDLHIQRLQQSIKNAMSQEKSAKAIHNSKEKDKHKDKYKFASRVNSSEKTLKSGNRVLSAANLLGNGKVSCGKKGKLKSELASRALKIWITYFKENTKFGMAYMLNSNATGFKYNDSTAMISNANLSQFKYIEYDQTTRKLSQAPKNSLSGPEMEQAEYKKYRILCHFHTELSKTKNEAQGKLPNDTRIKIEELKFRENSETTMKCYLTRYHCSNKCTIFWLSVGAIQVLFEDGSQLLINGNGVITYVNKYREMVYFEEKNKQGQNEEIKNKLQHFYSIIKTSLLKKQAVGENTNPEKPTQTMVRCNSSKSGSLGHSSVLPSSAHTKTSRHLKTSSSNANLVIGKSNKE